MLRLLRKLWHDNRGSLLATEWVFMATIMIIGIIPGMIAVRTSFNAALLKSACQLNSSSCACSGAVTYLPATTVVTISQSPCD
jgi:hypothetical protein